MTGDVKPMLRFRAVVSKLSSIPVITLSAESEYHAAQGVARLLMPGRNAMQEPSQPGVWRLYRHSRGENWFDNRTFRLAQIPTLEEKRAVADTEYQRLRKEGRGYLDYELLQALAGLDNALNDQIEAKARSKLYQDKIKALREQIKEARGDES